MIRKSFQPGVLMVIGAGLLSLTLSGCGHEREKLPPPEARSGDAKSIKVTVAPVTFRPVQRMVGVVGTLYGYEEISLGAKIQGRVRRISHDIADHVKPGTVLLEIDPTDYQLNVRQAQRALQVELAKLGLDEVPTGAVDITKIPTVIQAQLRRDNARIRMERAQTLVNRKASPEEELTERTSEFRVAQAEYENQVLVAKAGVATIGVKQEALALAKQQLQDTLIRVPEPSEPVPGFGKEVEYAITSRKVAEGSYIMPGTEVFKVVIERPLKFRGRVPERKSGEVRVGQKADVYTSAYQQPFPGEVKRINPAVDPQTRTFDVEILVPNEEGKLKPGGFGKTAIFTELDDHAPTVPLEALVHFAGVTKIFLVEGGKAKEVQVTIGMQSSDWVEIASPALGEGSQVITSGQTAIADGTQVAQRGGSKSAVQTEAIARQQNPVAKELSQAPVARREVVMP